MKNQTEINQSSFILKNLPFGILLEDIDRKIISVNMEFINLFNIPAAPSELVGLDCTSMAESAKNQFVDSPIFMNFINKCIKAKIRDTQKFEIINDRHVELIYIPYIINGEFAGHNWIYNNITDDIRNKKLIATNEQFYKNILDYIPADIVVFDVHHNYVFINKMAIKDDKLRAWMVGKTDYDYCKFRNVDIEIAYFREEQHLKVLNSKKIHSWQDTKTKKNGETETILRILNPFLNSKKDLKFIVGYGLDITEINKKDKKITEEANRNKQLLSNLKDVVFEANEKGNFTMMNTAWRSLTDLTEKETLSKHISSFFLENEAKKEFKNYLSNNNQIDLSIKLKLKTNNSYQYVKAFFSKIHDNNTKLESIWGTFSDITEEYKKEIILLEIVKKEKEINQLKTGFIQMVSHEVRTPLAGILSSVELLEIINLNTSKVLIDKNKKHYQSIISQIIRIGDLMSNVLLLGKVETGNVNIDLKKIDLVKKITDLLEEDFSLENAPKIKFKVVGKPFPVALDWKLFVHVIINLLSNAIKYSKHLNQPELVIYFEEMNVKIIVKDYGIGIPKKDIPKLFQSFSRASNVGNISGSGIGLILVKHMTELHNGTITVESKENHGSIFTIYLPL
ncbi:MAG: PAS domain-containing protein [Candidatus Sericytochromatia bacterium]|nr:PAS domain-containing protein [Candidatus Sericytochromatia bacterium]